MVPIPAGRPRYRSFLKPLMAIRSDRLVVSLISDQGYFTFLYGHTKHNPESEKKKKQKTKNTAWVSSKRKKIRSLWHFCAFSELTRECTRAKTPTKPLAMLTCLLALVNPASFGQQVLAVVCLTSVLLSSLSCFHLLNASCSPLSIVLCCSLLPTYLLLDLPSFVIPVSWWILEDF